MGWQFVFHWQFFLNGLHHASSGILPHTTWRARMNEAKTLLEELLARLVRELQFKHLICLLPAVLVVFPFPVVIFPNV